MSRSVSRFGPLLDENGVRFRLWAPSIAKVLLEIEGRAPLAMEEGERGWKEAFAACGPGTRYRFRVNDQGVPDPASRLQSGGVHGWSVVTKPFAADPAWKGRPWEEAVLYECHPGLMGGFRGIAEKLPALQALGITAIELMPIAQFPGARNWGYDGVLPFAPAEAYGTPEELRALIDRAHALQLMVFLDVVYNHFGPDGNYLPLYAKPFFRADSATPWGEAIDFRIPEVRDFFSENARYWLFEYGFDGLRFDAVHAMKDEGWLDALAQTLRDEAAPPSSSEAVGHEKKPSRSEAVGHEKKPSSSEAVGHEKKPSSSEAVGRKEPPSSSEENDETLRRIHLVLENEDNGASHLRRGFDAQWNDDIHHVFHVLLTGETDGYYRDYAERPAEKLARGLAEGFIYQGETSLYRGGKPRGEASAELPPTAFVDFLQNHDQTGNRPFGERLTTLAKPDALKAAIACLLLTPHIPMIFMGEEIGSRSPFLYFTDHGPQLAKLVREGRTREFKAFADAAHGALPDPNSEETFRLSDPARDAPEKESWRAYYSALLSVRRRHVMPRLKGARALTAEAIGEKSVLARWRMGDQTILTIATNLGTTHVPAHLPANGLIWGQAEAGSIPPCTTLAWVSHA